jgi:hypothetical protein
MHLRKEMCIVVPVFDRYTRLREANKTWEQ